MNRFDNIVELINFLQKDKDEASLCPLRFIHVDSIAMWIKIKQQLMPMVEKNIYLSDFCAQDDTLPKMRDFTSNLKEIPYNVCILPFSEFLRVQSSKYAKGIITDLIAAEYSGNTKGKLRIYIPMYRMRDILVEIPSDDPRKQDCINILSGESEQNYFLTVVQRDLQVNIIGNEIFGFKQYLQYWEQQNPNSDIILRTVNAKYFEKGHFFTNVKVITTAFDLLKTCYQLPTYCIESNGSDKYWARLATLAAKEKTFEKACCAELETDKFMPELFRRWADFDKFQKWLLWLWAKGEQRTGYLGYCINDSQCVDKFTELLYTKIISLLGGDHFFELYDERRKLIQNMNPSVPESFWEQIGGLQVLDKLRVLSDFTNRERTEIFELLKNIPNERQNEATSVIKIVYPTLYNYLLGSSDNEIENLSEDICDYFMQYRWYKAANILPQAFIDRVKEIALQKGNSVYKLDARNLVVNDFYKEHKENTNIIFVDGMGVEYVNYLWSILDPLKADGYEIHTKVGYCNLPSITEINKDFLTNKQVAKELVELDHMKHGKNRYPVTIESELQFLDSLNEEVKYAFKPGIKQVILTSDHGTSRMAVLVRDTEFDKKSSPEGHTVYKNGRYCEGTDMKEKFNTAIVYNDKLIFADYQRFAQQGSPIVETHGGASLEEWLVPVIVIEKVDVAGAKRIINIIPLTNQLRPDPMTNMVIVKFSLDEYNKNDVFVRIHGKKIICKLVDKKYEFEYVPKKGETEVETKVYVPTRSIGSFRFTVKQGISTNDMF